MQWGLIIRDKRYLTLGKKLKYEIGGSADVTYKQSFIFGNALFEFGDYAVVFCGV